MFKTVLLYKLIKLVASFVVLYTVKGKVFFYICNYWQI